MEHPTEKILSSIYEVVGHTPLVRLNRVPKDEGIECEVLGKCEFLNPGGSVKDRIGVEMFLEAEKEGRIKPGDTIIEATSGNAGIGLSFMAAAKGYKMVITLPEKMSNEKVSVLKSLGAEIIRTPTEAHTFDEDSHYMVARKINKERANSHILDQYANPNNPGAHYRGTGQEIYDQCGGKVDYVFIGVGTGGTIAGASKKLKELNPNIKIIGIDPVGSSLALPEEMNTISKSYHVEGIGYDFIPKVQKRGAEIINARGSSSAASAASATSSSSSSSPARCSRKRRRGRTERRRDGPRHLPRCRRAVFRRAGGPEHHRSNRHR